MSPDRRQKPKVTLEAMKFVFLYKRKPFKSPFHKRAKNYRFIVVKVVYAIYYCSYFLVKLVGDIQH